MGRREDEVRERMERDADIMRGVGGVIGLDDMRAYEEELNWAALEDGRRGAEEADRQELEDLAELNRLLHEAAEEADAEDEEILAEAEKEYWRIAEEERAEGLDYDDRDYYDKEVGT